MCNKNGVVAIITSDGLRDPSLLLGCTNANYLAGTLSCWHCRGVGALTIDALWFDEHLGFYLDLDYGWMN